MYIHWSVNNKWLETTLVSSSTADIRRDIRLRQRIIVRDLELCFYDDYYYYY
jgi:hypothetical protein